MAADVLALKHDAPEGAKGSTHKGQLLQQAAGNTARSIATLCKQGLHVFFQYGAVEMLV